MKFLRRYVTTISIAVLGAIGLAAYLLLPLETTPTLRPDDFTLVERGNQVDVQACASCHGVNLEGQANWRRRDAQGLFPAPPHDESGHTWHHADEVLFNITKNGIQQYAGADYRSAMPKFSGRLTDDDIAAALSYIESTWSKEIKRRHKAINESAAQQ
jgi:mono/diheme cytochrome c family protein